MVNVASIMSEQPRRDNAPYATSKGAIRQLTKALAVDWAAHGIRVNAIGPGYVKTEMTTALWQDASFDEWVCQRTPLARWGAPEEIGLAALFLASAAASYITGQVLYVDGGLLAPYCCLRSTHGAVTPATATWAGAASARTRRFWRQWAPSTKPTPRSAPR